MKKIVLLLFILMFQLTSGQSNYFQGQSTVCTVPDMEARKLYNLGLQCFQYEKFHSKATQIFIDLTKKDSTFCDAYFFAGYSLRLQNRLDEALAMYYMADSLSSKNSIIFKQNLATTAGYLGLAELAMEKYHEMIEYFPDSPEGYYGVAATTVFTEEYEEGLENVNIAISKYKANKEQIGKEVYMVKGILLTKLQRYEESIRYFDQIKGGLSKDDNYRMYYALSLKKFGELKNDASMIKKAKKLYQKIEDKTIILPEVRREFNG